MAENKRRAATSSDAGSALRAVLLISAVVMAVMLTVGGLYLLGNRGGDGEAKSEGEVQRYFADLIEEYENGEAVLPMDIPEMELEEAFALYSMANSSYYQEASVSYTGSGGEEISLKKQIIKDGARYFVRTFDGNTLTETIKCDGERVLIINEVTGKSVILDAKENSLAALAGLPDHENTAVLISEYLENEDGSSTLSKCSCSLKRAKAMNSLILDVTYRDTGISEKYYYYLDYGLIYQCESVIEAEGKRLSYYKMTTTAFSSDISEYTSEDSFSIEN